MIPKRMFSLAVEIILFVLYSVCPGSSDPPEKIFYYFIYVDKPRIFVHSVINIIRTIPGEICNDRCCTYRSLTVQTCSTKYDGTGF